MERPWRPPSTRSSRSADGGRPTLEMLARSAGRNLSLSARLDVREDLLDLVVGQGSLEARHSFVAPTIDNDRVKGRLIYPSFRDRPAQVGRHDPADGVVPMAARTMDHVLPPSFVFDPAGLPPLLLSVSGTRGSECDNREREAHPGGGPTMIRHTQPPK